MPHQWYTIFSKPNKEFQVANYLSHKGITVYYPSVRVKPSNPRCSKIRSFFPRYLFVHTDLQVTGTSVLQWIPGGIGLVSFDGIPAIVPDEFIETLRLRLKEINSIGHDRLVDLKRGDTVTIVDGPFAGYEAIFDMRLSSSDRVLVFLKWLGRETKTQLSINSIDRRRKA
jgi:transcription antitermination factor NusG